MRKSFFILITIFLACLISCKQEPAFEPEEITFGGKQFDLVYFDDFDKDNYSDDWNFFALYAGQEGKYGDGSFITSKLGEVDEFNNVYITDSEGKDNAFTEDGVMHLVQTRVYDENTKDWSLCLPFLDSRAKFPVNSLFEIKYKMEVKGELSCYSICLWTPDRYKVPNENGFTFKELYGCELISGKKDGINYDSNIWVGTSDIEYYKDLIIPELSEVYMPDEKFYEWHICKILYTDSGFYVWHDGVQTYDYRWDSDIYGAPGCEVEIHFGNNTCGDWSKNLLEWMGKIDKSRKSVDFMLDYVKVYTLVD